MIRFSALMAFVLAISAILVILVFIYTYRKGVKELPVFYDPGRRSAARAGFFIKWTVSLIGFLGFYFNCLLVLSGLTAEEEKASFKPLGRDIVFLVDVSKSMWSNDVKPSRVDLSLTFIREVCRSPAPNTRFGVAVFRGQGLAILPLTEDTVSVSSFMDFIDSNLITSPGTNVAAGLGAAADLFLANQERLMEVWLFTDGEALAGNLEPPISRLANLGVDFTIIATGTSKGGPIPLAEGGYLTDAQGNRVYTKVDRNYLNRLAQPTNGKVYYVENHEEGDSLARQLKTRQSLDSDFNYLITKEEGYRFNIAIAILGLVLFRGIRVVRWVNLS